MPSQGEDLPSLRAKIILLRERVTLSPEGSTPRKHVRKEGSDCDQLYGSDEVRKVSASAWPGYSTRARRSEKNH